MTSVPDASGPFPAEAGAPSGEAWLREVLDTIPARVFWKDREGRFLGCNRAFAHDAGVERSEDLQGRDDFALCWHDQAEAYRADDRQVMESGAAKINFEEVQTAPDGRRIWLRTTKIPLRDGSGNVIGMLGTYEDITERKLAEEALRKSEERFRITAENTGQLIYDYDCTSGAIHWAGAITQITGFGPGEFQTVDIERWAELVHPEDRGQAVSLLRQKMASAEPYNTSYRLRRKDGTYVWMEESGSFLMDAQGRAYRMVGAIKDISSQRRAAEDQERLQGQLLQAQKLESVGRLAGGVAHDFNNLLTVINGYTQMLLGTLKPADPLRNGLGEVLRAGERAAELTQQLLAFSRKQVLQLRMLSLDRVVSDLEPMLARLVGEDVEVNIREGAPDAVVRADPGQIEQVILNLVVNARDAMPHGGMLTIETAEVDLSESYTQWHLNAQPGRYVVLAVSDTGVGMDEATRERIFEPFFTTKEPGKGTGLGLSTVQGIVGQTGGSVEVYSEPGQGTSFKIYLPRVDEAPMVEGAATPAAPDVHGCETILVVEDQAEVRNYAAAALKTFGYRVLTAENAGEALLVLEQGTAVDLVLSDVVMPKLSGRELAARLEAVRPGLKVLFMSGYTDDVVVRHGVLDEGVEFIQKPFSPERLAAKVRAVLGPPRLRGRILVVDDEPSVRGLLRAVLENGGYEVAEASEGGEALEHLRRHQTDLILTDLIMPGQEGIETIRILRRQQPDLAIIAISGRFDGPYLKTASLMGADAVLPKPVSSDLLLAKVTELLARRG